MSELYDIFSQIRGCSSTIGKLEIMKANNKNEELKTYFSLCCDPMITFHIKKIPTFDGVGNKNINWVFEQLRPLSSRSKTGNKAIDHLRNMFESISQKDQILLRNIINKNSVCGVSIATANKVWKNHIKKEPYQRFRKESEKNWDLIRYTGNGAISTCKLDGEFSDLQIRGSQKSIEVVTRGGHVLNFGDKLHPILDKLFDMPDIVMHCEILVWDEENQIFMPRQTGNGILNSHFDESMIENFHFGVINTIFYDSFIDGEELTRYEDRLKLTESLCEIINHQNFKAVEWEYVKNREDAIRVHEIRRERGEEGSVLYSSDLIWESTGTGTAGAMKQKQREPVDLEVTDSKPLKKDGVIHENLIGSLKCESRDGKVVVWCGSLKDEFRSMDPNDIIGKIITIWANDVLQDKSTKEFSLFLPGFNLSGDIIRKDKHEADSFEEICDMLKAHRFKNKAQKVTKNVLKKKNVKKVEVKTTDIYDMDW